MDHSRRSGRLRTTGVALLALAPVAAVLSLGAAPGPSAVAATPGNYLVTFVARSCPQYTDIAPNLARNNIQESLQDLRPGASPYQPGQPISPSVETPNQPNCTPLANWQFQFGNGINGTTPGTNLSRVSNPVSPPITTQSSVPLLDTGGNPTGSSLAGAVTTTLTQSQVTQAANHQLWVQGGTSTDPLGNTTFPDKYAFGALRCAIDNLNGDNVEWVGFPTGQTHVFCYYYAVALPPKPGVITISKVLTSAGSSTPTFPFTGNISYNPGGAFDVKAGSSISFTRDSNVDWSFVEDDVPGYLLTSAVCTSADGHSTFNNLPSPATFGPNVQITVNLAAGDHVSCVYTNTRDEVHLTVLKQTVGGEGTFPVDVTSPPPSSAVTHLFATTTTDGVPVEACPTGSNPPCQVTDVSGTYTLAETLPASPDGTWRNTAFDCNGTTQTPTVNGDLVTVGVVTSANENLACTFTNTFTPTGSITITKTTTGATGTTEFTIVPTTSSGQSETADPVYSATTTAAGVPATATQVSGDYSLDALDVGQYSIVESGPDATAAGTWAPQPVTCNGASTDPTSSAVLVTLPAADPHVTCAFTNAFTATPPTTTTTSTSTSTTTAPTTTTSSVPGGVAANDTGVSGGGLAMTGEDVRLPLGIAGGLALAGATLLIVDRARRRPAPVVVRRRRGPPPT